ncbi:unnamed protein product [Phaeothamnion confervicola]
MARTAPSSTVEGKKHVLVIGCGASGLTVMKEVLQLGHRATCCDTMPVIGGVYAKSYDNTILTTSSCLTAFSDYSDGLENKPKFWTDEEYLAYLDGFAKKFNLYECINFRTSIEKLKRCPETGQSVDSNNDPPAFNIREVDPQSPASWKRETSISWTAWIKRNRASPPHRAYPATPAEDPNEPTEELSGFDAVAICTGTNTWACRPCFKGEECYKGEIIHSEKYRTPSDFAGKKVLVVGSGESGSDICNEISRYAAKTGISCRGKHGHLIPRIQSDGRVTDLNTNRARYSNPYVLGDWVGWANQKAKKFVAQWGRQTDEKKVLAKIGELNLEQKTSAFSKFGCKNAGFVEAMVLRGATMHRGDFELKEDKVVFADGTEFDADIIVACTGFRNNFPFVLETHPDIDQFGCNPRWLYKQVFHPNYNGEVAYFGFARPAFGSIPPTAEMQSRMFAMVLNGDLSLPDSDTMCKTAAKDQENWEMRFGYDAKRVKGLVDFQIYADDLADIMGVRPPLRRLFFTNPKIWWKIMFGPFTMHQYRLVGPSANPKRAADVYERQPVGDLLESSITATFLITAKVLSLLGLKQ